MKQTYTGGCHCGAVRFEADIDLRQGTLKCNCSICRRSRAWLIAVNARDFRLLQGEDALSDYQFGAKRIHHLFCKHCGIKSFSRSGQHVAVAVSCLDGVSDEELAALPVTCVNGREDNFQTAPAETRHL